MVQASSGSGGIPERGTPERAEARDPVDAPERVDVPNQVGAQRGTTVTSAPEPLDVGSSAARRGHFLLLLVALVLVIGAWSLATPLMAAPDEPAQAAQAAALVRGQIDEPQVAGPIGPLSEVRVPAWVQSAAFLPNCFAFRPARSARCPTVVGTNRAPVTMKTQFSNYPPLYFAWVGLPSLALSGTGALYAMRLASALANAALLALGIYLLARYHSRRFPLIGALVAITPMLLFLSAVINASGLEIAAAFASWCAGLCVIEDREIPPMLATWTSVAFAVFILSRPLSPFDAAVVLTVLAALAGRRRLRTLRTAPRALLIGFVILGAAVVAGVALLIGGSPGLLGAPLHPPLSFGAAFHEVLMLDPSRLEQGIGLFGWTDTPIPHLVTVLWIVLTSGICLVGLVRAPRFLLAFAILALAILAMPVIFEIPKINQVGAYWQGRYWLPLLVGIPLSATAASGRVVRGRARAVLGSPMAAIARAGVVVIVCALVVWAQVAAFLLALHRYTTGLGRPPGTPIEWTPPGGVVAVVTVFILGELLLVACLLWMAARPKRPHLHRHTRRSGLAAAHP